MDDSKRAKTNIDDMITLCLILDEYELFENDLFKLLEEEKKKQDFLCKLHNSLNGELIIEKKIKEFCVKHKRVLNVINDYSGFFSFVLRNYDLSSYKEGKFTRKDCFLYDYILRNRLEIDKIVAVLLRLKKIGFGFFQFDENDDFTKEEYSVNVEFDKNYYMTYLENMKIIPGYSKDKVKYRTSFSHYKILMTNLFYQSEQICLNDLMFDVNALPKKLDKEKLFNSIVSIRFNKEEILDGVKNSVDLHVGIDGISELVLEYFELVNKIDDLKGKEELLDLLIKMKEIIVKVKVICEEYDIDLENRFDLVDKTLLINEKELYLKKKRDIYNFED